MSSLRHLLTRVSEDVLLVALLVGLVPLLWLMPEHVASLPGLVDWNTIGALAGLMVLSRGLEDSGYLALAGRRMLAHLQGERALATVLVLFSAALSAVVTNDVALFIVVPLTLGLRLAATIPVGRLIIFEALAVNAGSTLSPVGNPQNLYLWQSTGMSFVDFGLMMAPLAAGMILLMLLAVPIAFPAVRIAPAVVTTTAPLDPRLLRFSLALYPVFLVLTELGFPTQTAIAVILLYLVIRPRVLLGVDWLLLAVFVLMFIDLGLLASLPALQHLSTNIDAVPGGVFVVSTLLSQVMSNVPATIFLSAFTDDIRALAWGVSVGGFGVAIGSLANLIALRLSRQPGLWREFHGWSIPMLLLSFAFAGALLAFD